MITPGVWLMRLLWPDRCAACQANIIEGQVFCEPCQATVLPIEGACPRCAVPEDDGQRAGAWAVSGQRRAVGSPTCRPCTERPFPFVAARACLLYGGAVADAIVRFKHGRGLAPARSLGRALVPLLDWGARRGVDAVLPVPLHPARLRHRGFNQALELVREANRHRARRRSPVIDAQVRASAAPLPVWTSALLRIQDTPPLARESPAVRRARLHGAFVVVDRERIRGRRLLVVDDVMTSGATLAECAQVLNSAGAREVLVGALARTTRSSTFTAATDDGAPLPP